MGEERGAEKWPSRGGKLGGGGQARRRIHGRQKASEGKGEVESQNEEGDGVLPRMEGYGQLSSQLPYPINNNSSKSSLYTGTRYLRTQSALSIR